MTIPMVNEISRLQREQAVFGDHLKALHLTRSGGNAQGFSLPSFSYLPGPFLTAYPTLVPRLS
jgi:hypothetical protein